MLRRRVSSVHVNVPHNVPPSRAEPSRLYVLSSTVYVRFRSFRIHSRGTVRRTRLEKWSDMQWWMNGRRLDRGQRKRERENLLAPLTAPSAESVPLYTSSISRSMPLFLLFPRHSVRIRRIQWISVTKSSTWKRDGNRTREKEAERTRNAESKLDYVTKESEGNASCRSVVPEGAHFR